jgi:quinol monooxygenase YgiN
MLRLLALAGLVFAALDPSAALAQNAAFFTGSYIEVGPVLAKVGALALRGYRDGNAGDKNIVDLDVLERIDRPSHFVVLAAWTDKAAYEAHAAGAPIKKLYEKLATLLAAPIDVRRHNALTVAPPKPGKDRLFIVTHIDVVPAQKDNAVAALEQLADESRKHAGNLQFDVWQQEGRPNHFTVVEVWGNRGAFDLHQMQKETREFRGKLAAMTGALYDERLYRPLSGGTIR